MTDKYPKLRQDLAAAIADAKRQGGVNERAEQIAALLAERDTLAAAPVSAEPVAWVRRHPDGALTAEFLEHDVIEPVRKNSGAWVPLYTAPVATQPDVTQQTLDDVKAGIPARDAEIAELRKQVETLQAQLVDRSTEMQRNLVDETPNLQSQQQPVSGADASRGSGVTWADAQKLAGMPAVDSALEVFCNGGTAENALALVRAVMIAQQDADNNDELFYKLGCFIDYATGGRLSKLNWSLEMLKQSHDENIEHLIDERIQESKEDEQDADKVSTALAKMVHAMFRSGNSIPVTRITIDRKQYEAAIDAARKEQV